MDMADHIDDLQYSDVINFGVFTIKRFHYGYEYEQNIRW